MAKRRRLAGRLDPLPQGHHGVAQRRPRPRPRRAPHPAAPPPPRPVAPPDQPAPDPPLPPRPLPTPPRARRRRQAGGPGGHLLLRLARPPTHPVEREPVLH